LRALEGAGSFHDQVCMTDADPTLRGCRRNGRTGLPPAALVARSVCPAATRPAHPAQRRQSTSATGR